MKSVYEMLPNQESVGSNQHAFNLSQNNLTIKPGHPNYALAAFKDMSSINNDYTNARYAPTGSDETGKPFPMYKDFGGRMTTWNSSASSMSTIKKQMALPTDTTAFRTGITNDSMGIGNDSLTGWVYGTQTLANKDFANRFCTNNTDCAAYGSEYKCNSNYEPWNDAYGSQSGSVCSKTIYPELKDGSYSRSLSSNGGIGRGCTTNTDCNTDAGYECNNQVDMFGKNIQQSGYCSQTYTCDDDKKRYLGYPYNSGIPQVPPSTQNNNGNGYSSKEECSVNSSAQQDCIQDSSGAWFAVYPGYCPVGPVLRKGPTGQGALRVSTMVQVSSGFTIPQYGPVQSSSLGSSDSINRANALNFSQKTSSEMNEPLQYSLSINPRVMNEQQ